MQYAYQDVLTGTESQERHPQRSVGAQVDIDNDELRLGSLDAVKDARKLSMRKAR